MLVVVRDDFSGDNVRRTGLPLIACLPIITPRSQSTHSEDREQNSEVTDSTKLSPYYSLFPPDGFAVGLLPAIRLKHGEEEFRRGCVLYFFGERVFGASTMVVGSLDRRGLGASLLGALEVWRRLTVNCIWPSFLTDYVITMCYGRIRVYVVVLCDRLLKLQTQRTSTDAPSRHRTCGTDPGPITKDPDGTASSSAAESQPSAPFSFSSSDRTSPIQ